MSAPGISTAIMLTDQMTPVLQNVISAMNVVVNSAGKVDEATKNMFSPSDIDAVRGSLLSAEVGMRQIEAETNKAHEAQRKYNEEASKSGGLIGGLKNKVMGLVGAYAGIKSVQAFVGMSDQMSQIKARLDSMNTSFKDSDEFLGAIYQSAQRARGDLVMTADIVAKLGTQAKNAFGSNQETIAFAENLNKIFTLSGTDASGIQSVMYNLTQAMGTGVLRGQDLNAVMSNAPRLMEIVAEHMGTGIENIRKLAEEGELSSKVIKEALLSASTVKEINEEFEKMPMTFGQIAQSIKNQFLMAMQPAFNAFNKFLNSDRFQRFAQGVADTMGVVATGISFAIQGIVTVASFAYDAWERLKAPILIVAGAVAFYKAQLVLVKGVETAVAFTKNLMAAATWRARAAQVGLNTAMLASPAFWIPLAIMGVVYALTLLTKHIFHVENTAYSSIGGILGAVNVAKAVVVNTLYFIWNKSIDAAMAIDNGFKTMVENVANYFVNLGNFINKAIASSVTGVLNKIEKATTFVDKFTHTDFTSGIENAKAAISAWEDKNSFKKIELERADYSKNKVEYTGLKDAYNQGYNFGKGLQEKAKKVLSPQMPGGMENMQNGVMPVDPRTGETVKPGKETAKSSKKTADNTKKIKDKLDDGINIRNEDLKYLRELAVARGIDHYSIGLDRVMVEVNNQFGDVHENVDLDGWQSSLADNLKESIYKSVGGAGLESS